MLYFILYFRASTLCFLSVLLLCASPNFPEDISLRRHRNILGNFPRYLLRYLLRCLLRYLPPLSSPAVFPSSSSSISSGGRCPQQVVLPLPYEDGTGSTTHMAHRFHIPALETRAVACQSYSQRHHLPVPYMNLPHLALLVNKSQLL